MCWMLGSCQGAATDVTNELKGENVQFKRITTREPENAGNVSTGIYPNLAALNLDHEHAGNKGGSLVHW